MANKPFKKGDVIDVAGTEGIVDSIDLFVTTLKTFDNKVVTVPNGTVTTSVIVNYSMAVSYTHLDVYKRQMPEQAVRNFAARWPGNWTDMRDGAV